MDVMVEETFVSKFLRVPQYSMYRIYGICVEEGFGGYLSSPLDVVAHTAWRTRQGAQIRGDTGNKWYGGHCGKDIWATQGVDVIAEEYPDQNSKSYMYFGIHSTGVRILRGGRLQILYGGRSRYQYLRKRKVIEFYVEEDHDQYLRKN